MPCVENVAPRCEKHAKNMGISASFYCTLPLTPPHDPTDAIFKVSGPISPKKQVFPENRKRESVIKKIKMKIQKRDPFFHRFSQFFKNGRGPKCISGKREKVAKSSVVFLVEVGAKLTEDIAPSLIWTRAP